jgi:penicillin-binding protein 2
MLFDDLPIQRRTTQAPPPDESGGRRRLLIMMATLLLVFAALNVRIFSIQTTQRDSLERQAQRNQRVLELTAGARGLIYDRNGIPLVRNTPIYQVVILPVRQVSYSEDTLYIDPRTNQPITDTRTGELVYNDALIQQRIERIAVYNRLAQIVNQPGVTAGEIYTRVFRARQNAQTFRPVVVVDSVPRETALIIQEQSLLLPGVQIQTIGSRAYPYGEMFGKIMGYTGKIQDFSVRRFGLERNLSDPDYRDYFRDINYGGYAYDLDKDRIGIEGIELTYERELRGVKGERSFIVDVSYEEKGEISRTVPTAGNSVRLTLDLRAQSIMSEEVAYGMRESGAQIAAAVMLNPNTGEILGMVSFPTIDNNVFAAGISDEAQKSLNDNPYRPQVFHATQSLVEPGSTFKIVTTAAILQEKSDSVEAYTQIDDPGRFELPNEANPDAKGQEFFCWIGLPPRNSRHGPQTAEEALKNSCDAYYYKSVGGYKPDNIKGIGSEVLAAWARAFGIGEDSYNFGLGYSPGYAASREGNLKRGGGLWTQGSDYNVAIGQGDTRATVLEMANVTAVIANGGTLYAPQLVRDVINPQNQIVRPFEPQVTRQLPLESDVLQLIRRGMWRVVNEEGGTANYSASLQKWGLEYAGKTGTAEYCDVIAFKARLCPPDSEFFPTHAWYVAYAPYDQPQIAIATWFYNGGQGSGVAAPITARIIARYLNLPVPPEELPKVVPAQSE